MKTMKIYFPGCKRCETADSMVRETTLRLGVAVEVGKITDAKSIAMAGVMSTQGLSVDGKLVHAGGLPDAANPEGWLST